MEIHLPGDKIERKGEEGSNSLFSLYVGAAFRLEQTNHEQDENEDRRRGA
jgi:hypothetical protein